MDTFLENIWLIDGKISLLSRFQKVLFVRLDQRIFENALKSPTCIGIERTFLDDLQISSSDIRKTYPLSK